MIISLVLLAFWTRPALAGNAYRYFQLYKNSATAQNHDSHQSGNEQGLQLDGWGNLVDEPPPPPLDDMSGIDDVPPPVEDDQPQQMEKPFPATTPDWTSTP